MDDVAPAAGGAAEKKRPLLRRVPTSLIVTLLGIALTAWLLPAFTRQWDDRQKAQDLRATVASQIAAATSQALIAGKQVQRLVSGPAAGRSDAVARDLRKANDNLDRLDDQWLLDSIAIEAKLRAYFSPTLVSRLHAYNHTMRWLFAVAAFGNTGSSKREADALGLSRTRLHRDLRLIYAGLHGNVYAQLSAEDGYTDITNAVLSRQNDLIGSILSAHVDGYSTTTRDLLRDLVP